MADIGTVTPVRPTWPKRLGVKIANKKPVGHERGHKQDKDEIAQRKQDGEDDENPHFDGYA